MIERTKISTVFQGFRNVKPLDISMLEEVLIRVGNLAIDFPEISALDINPLLVKNGKIIAVDARVMLSPDFVPAPMHLIISSYPRQYECEDKTEDGVQFFIRPIVPSDADLLIEHFNALSPRSIHMRFFAPMKQLSKELLIRLTQIDYDREIALVAVMGKGQQEKIIGVCRIILMTDGPRAEFAIAIRDDWQGKGIGKSLLKQCLKAAWQKGLEQVFGLVLKENTQMRNLARNLGFDIKYDPDMEAFELTIDHEKMGTLQGE